MEKYSRKEKNNSTSNRKPASQHIKTGFSALQKTIATIASLLSIVIACFTIMNLMNNNDSKSKADTGNSTTTTTIIKEVEKESTSVSSTPTETSSATETETSSSS